MNAALRLLAHRVVVDQDARLKRSDRVVEIMQSSRQGGLQASGRRGDARLSHRR